MKINKKRIVKLIILIIFLIIVIKAFSNSRAQPFIDITAEIVDVDGVVANELYTIQAVDEGNLGKVITLPSVVNQKKIEKYIIELKEIENEELNNEQLSNTETEQKVEELKEEIVEKLPEDESVENKIIENNESETKEVEPTNVVIDNTVIDEKNTVVEGDEKQEVDSIEEKENNLDTNKVVENKAENIIETKTENVIENTVENTVVNKVEEKIEQLEAINKVQEENKVEDVNIDKNVEIAKQQVALKKDLLPGEKLYLTKEEISNKKITLTVKYEFKEKDNEKLYNKILEKVIDNNKVELTGYMPSNASLSVKKVELEAIQDMANNQLNTNSNVKVAYDIKIVVGGIEYNPEDFEEQINVTFYNVETEVGNKENYRMIHINDQNEIEEIENFELNENSVSFEAKSFSTYALIEGTGVNQVYASSAAVLQTQLVWDGQTRASSFLYGNGSEAKPYLITSGEELAYFANEVTNGNLYENKYIQLGCDIDLGNHEWQTIGTAQNSFRGIFDGAGHTIANAKIIVSTLPTNTYDSYGFFGSVGGDDSKAIIRNLELSSVDISITASGSTGSRWGNQNNAGLHIGIMAGTVYKNSNIVNIIVKNCKITDTNVIDIYNSNFHLSIGGVVGYIGNTYSNDSDPGNNNRYVIENCFSDTTIDIDATAQVSTSNSYWEQARDGRGHYHTGGIIGTIRAQAVWPIKCLYKGNIDSNGYIGPCFAALINYTDYSSSNGFTTIWNGNDAGYLNTNDMYYSSYMANGTSFTSSVQSGDSLARINNSSTETGYIQGVNKGVYTTDMSAILNIFNSNNLQDKKYVTWIYENDTFVFKERLSTTLKEISDFNYKIQISDPYNIGNYNYVWYKNGSVDTSIVGDTYVWIPNYIADEDILVIANDGTYFSTARIVIEKLRVDIVFNVNTNNDSVNASLEGKGLKYTTVNDYEFQWYKEDISGESELLENQNTLTLTNLELYYDYKLVATNIKIPELSTENIFTYGDRTVIYVNYSSGNNENNGLTEDTPVKDLATAYGKLDSEGSRNKNVIVLIGGYTDTSVAFLNSRTSSTYKKNATITGKYRNKDYEARLIFGTSSNFYRHLTADLTFQYLSLDGQYGSIYMCAQGNNVTFGEGVKMINYNTSNTNQGLLGSKAPAFHFFAGWYQYNYSELPQNNSEIIIKSGTFGRVILGGTPGTSSGLNQSTSRNFMGSSKEDTFNVTITVNIKNSTTPSNYDYDINLLVGGSASGNNYSNVVENIYAGKVGRVLGGSIGDTSSKPRNWSYPINTFLGTATINVYGGSIEELYGGCLGRNMNVVNSPNATGNTCDSYYYGDIYINIINGTINRNIYGAGAGGVTGYSTNSSDPYKSYGQDFDTSVNINVTGGVINGNIYGGGYGYTEYLNANVTAQDGGALYGNTNIEISGSPIITGNIYAAGCGYDLPSKPNIAQMEGTTQITVSGTPEILGQIFGAGAGVSGYAEMAKLNGSSNINIESDLDTQVYGGGNIAKTSGTTNVNIGNGNHTADIYGGGYLGNVDGTSNVNINGGTQLQVYGGGMMSNVTESVVNVNGGNTENIYGGGYQAGANKTQINSNGGIVNNLYGGSNMSGDITNSYIEIKNSSDENRKVQNLYGGNNKGGKTINSNITLVGNGVVDVYGGGNQAVVETTNLNISGTVLGKVFGGGKQSSVENNTNVKLDGAIIEKNVYGGGDEGSVEGNTYVYVKDSILKNDLFAGGNGATAIVYGNTNLFMDGTENIVAKNVFGGGNKAETGSETTNNSISTVNIVGGKIGRNVYGGACTSIVFGTTQINIGYDAVNNNSLVMGDIEIEGTVFGGGEANEEGSEIYDFDFISVTEGIDIQINADKHEKFKINGSIFGSGNASSTSGDSYITIKNYGTPDNPKANISLQRATCATIVNSAMSLYGIKDRTNEYSNVDFSISKVDKVKLKNNSTLYLCNGVNLLKELESVVDNNGVEEKSIVTIDRETGNISQRNVDNRIYMLEGKNLNIATNEQVTAYGTIKGMIFLGLFTNKTSPNTSTGLYNHTYKNGDKITNAGTFLSNSYAMAQHMVDHNPAIDGFYTNFNDEGNIKLNYIKTTPEDDVYYIWLIGEELDVTVFNIDLIASKYATLGTYELLLQGFSSPNIKFSILGFSAGLENGISLVEPTEIESVEPNQSIADSVYGLSMKTGNIGWQMKGKTTFLTEQGGIYSGTKNYDANNSSYTPTLNFCFYHSENISLEQDLGEVRIRLQVLTPKDDLNYKLSYIDIIITLSTALYQNDFYEVAITPGQEFELFTTTETTLTSDSAFSTYYSLYIEEFNTSKYYEDYKTYKRVLVSRDSENLPYALPENTKITMIDLITNQYYYYIVTKNDVQNNKYIYEFSDFLAMGSSNKKFDEVQACDEYYKDNQNLIYENFIFHINFLTADIQEDIYNNSLLIELRDSEDETLIGALGIQRETMLYSVYNSKDATISLSGNANKNIAYLGENIELDVITSFSQEIINSKTVYDTKYFDKKLGIKISFYDSDGNRLNNDSLLGLKFELDGKLYYPRIDGTTRINISDKVTDVLAKIKIDTRNNSTLATGDYKIVIESFGSADGIYYGLVASDKIELDMKIINLSYGLKVITDENSKIIDKETGNTGSGTNRLTTNIEYSSFLSAPSIVVSLYRRDYSEIFSQKYNLVDLKDYVKTDLKSSSREKEYIVSENPTNSIMYFLTLKSDLITGTYKVVYKLYDGEAYVGEDYEYIIIK